MLLKYSSRFKKDLKLYKHDKETLIELGKVLDTLSSGKPLSKKNNNHPLIGEFKGCFECHIKPDILLIYKIEKAEIVVLLLKLGSHPELF